MKAKVNDGCISCGACVAACPEVFRFDEDGLAEAYADSVPPECEASAVDARDCCPVAVIDLEEA
ncbi:MAG TPA: ferredoxin [Candidatus Dorea gallistercoris]|uniref:Ferredoxin n=1 Tax=Candidatus Dorea gallistercoris TaxID=2838542 RepID=A0A9D1R9C5_9FIRM|nr:ferredoxin [Candidatus Dorea gallistercoris]